MGREFAVGSRGITLPDWVSGPVDVLFDGTRIWSFNPARDARPDGDRQLVPWPQPLRPHLEGVTEASLVSHVDGTSLYAAETRFGKSSDDRIRLEDKDGNPLALDKGGRLQRTFSHTGDAMREQIVDAVVDVLRDLREECGLDAYLAYGCLLGAVRNGKMIGHDSDADVSYLSRYTHPFDIIRESYRVYRVMRRRGWPVVRMSGADFKVWVPLPDGRRCGIDVFGSFHIGDHFHIMGSLRGQLDRSAVLPLGTVTLEGRELAAPHRPEEFLEFTYGPGWRVPDPAFHFDHDKAVVRRMDAWFRATRRRYRLWHDFYKTSLADKVPTEPSRFAHWVHERLPAGSQVLDAGCGTGRDSVWLATSGHKVAGIDFAGTHRDTVSKLAKKHRVKIAHNPLNYENLRAVLLSGARYAFLEQTHEVYARGLLDALSDDARANFWRWASMVQRRGGHTYVEFRTPASRRERKAFGRHYRQYLDPAAMVREIEERGGLVIDQVIGRGLAPLGPENPEICRLVVRWNK